MPVKGGINHVTLRVQNIRRSESFYCDLLGLEKVGSRPAMGFYSSGLYNHELALLEDPQMGRKMVQPGGLVHIGFNVEDRQALSELYQACLDAGLATSSGVDHIISHSFYTNDPDGYVIEITTDMPDAAWKQNPAAFQQDYPVELPA